MKTKNDLEQIVQKGYDLDFSKTFDEIFEYFKKTCLLNGLVLLIVSLSLIILSFFVLGASSLMDKFSDPTAVQTMFEDTQFLIYYSLFIIFLTILMAPLSAGFIQLNRDLDTQNEVGISSIFKHYQSTHFLQIVGFTLITQVVAVSLGQIPFVGPILTYVISWFTFLGVPLIIFSNLNAVQALEYSIKIVAKNPWNILLILIVSVLISIVGIFALCIGIFFTIPILYSAFYVLYKNIVGFKEDTIIEEIERDIENI